jgi:signal transduction histidine kinase
MSGMADAAGSQTPRYASIRPSGVVGAAITSCIVVATALGVARQDPLMSTERKLPGWLILLELAAAAAITAAAWVAATHHPHASIGLAAVAAGAALPLWAGWSTGPTLRPSVLAAPPLAVAGAAHLMLRWREGSRTTEALRAVYTLTVAAVAVHLIGYNPFADPACWRTCVDVASLGRRFIDTHSAVVLTCALTIAAVAFAALAVLRARPAPAPVLVTVATLCALGLAAAVAALDWARWGDSPGSDITRVGPSIAIVLQISGAVLVDAAVGTGRTRVAVDRLVSRLATPEAGWGDLGRVIREVHFAVPDDGRWVDVKGDDVADDPGAGRSVVVFDEAGPMLRLLLAQNVDATDVLARLGPATRLSLRNAQLSAVTRARLADVQASRRRIVATSDAERERIERDLHDGAQQRLVSAAFHLRVARSRLPGHTAPVERAEAEVHEALAYLRRLSHGIFPSILATEGLHAALEELVAAAEVSATLDISGCDDVDTATAMAAYAMVEAALDCSPRESTATISVARGNGHLTICVETDGAAALSNLTDVADRVGAVGGDVTTASTQGRVIMTAVLPCAS